MNRIIGQIKDTACRCQNWLGSEENKQKARELRKDALRAFTDHPHETGETYFEHLWFTLKMSARFLFTLIVLTIHGIFPFLLMRTASAQIEQMYRIMRSRVPKARRDAIDLDYQV